VLVKRDCLVTEFIQWDYKTRELLTAQYLLSLDCTFALRSYNWIRIEYTTAVNVSNIARLLGSNVHSTGTFHITCIFKQDNDLLQDPPLVFSRLQFHNLQLFSSVSAAFTLCATRQTINSSILYKTSNGLCRHDYTIRTAWARTVQNWIFSSLP
jgi:hypothetical protein